MGFGLGRGPIGLERGVSCVDAVCDQLCVCVSQLTRGCTCVCVYQSVGPFSIIVRRRVVFLRHRHAVLGAELGDRDVGDLLAEG